MKRNNEGIEFIEGENEDKIYLLLIKHNLYK